MSAIYLRFLAANTIHYNTSDLCHVITRVDNSEVSNITGSVIARVDCSVVIFVVT